MSTNVVPLEEHFERSVKSLTEHFYRRRLSVLRGNTRGDDWQDGVHFPSMMWGRIVGCCILDERLWDRKPSFWEIRAGAHEAAYYKFVEEIRSEEVKHGGPPKGKENGPAAVA